MRVRESEKKYYHRNRYESLSFEKNQIMSSGTLILPLLRRATLPEHPGDCLENQECSSSLPLHLWSPCYPRHPPRHLPKLPESASVTSPSCEDQASQTPPPCSHSLFSNFSILYSDVTLFFDVLTQPSPQNKDPIWLCSMSPNRAQCSVYSGHPLNVN